MPVERDDHAERMARIERLLERVQREQSQLRVQLDKSRDAHERRTQDLPVAVDRRRTAERRRAKG